MKLFQEILIIIKSQKAMFFCVFIVVLLSGCKNEEPKSEATIMSPFERAEVNGEIIPIANGNAYLLGIREIFYINGHTATRVTGISNSTTIAGQIIALSDGSAIFQLPTGKNKGLYRLNANVATKISESNTAFLDHKPINGAFLLTQNQKFRLENRENIKISN